MELRFGGKIVGRVGAVDYDVDSNAFYANMVLDDVEFIQFLHQKTNVQVSIMRTPEEEKNAEEAP